MNTNVILGFALAFVALGLMNMLVPTTPYFSVKNNPEATKKRGRIRLIFAVIIFAIYYYKQYL